jgi:hypothetical protein
MNEILNQQLKIRHAFRLVTNISMTAVSLVWHFSLSFALAFLSRGENCNLDIRATNSKAHMAQLSLSHRLLKKIVEKLHGHTRGINLSEIGHIAHEETK